jgi:AraC family L-rhamnose operon transcriptional activator RhaR
MALPPVESRTIRNAPLSAGPTRITANRVLVEREFAPHDHEEMIIGLVLKGKGTHRTIYGGEPVRAGDVFILRPGMWHAFVECANLDAFVCYFGPELLQRELSWLLEDPALNYLFRVGPRSLDRKGIISLHIPPEARKECQRCLEGILAHQDLEPVRARTVLVGYLLLFLGQIARWAASELHLPSKKQRTERVHRVVIEGMRLLKEDLARDWTLKELADALKVEKSYVVRLFKTYTGLSPIAYLAHCRAERAATLLLTTSDSITDIAQRVGWSDPNYFARRFRSHFGISASTFRDRLQTSSS